MQLKNVKLVYFSATDTTRKTLHAIADGIGISAEEVDFTLPAARLEKHTFTEEDFVLFGVPVYGGLLPALVKDYLLTVKGKNTPCAIVVLYGNREFDDCLVELEDLVTANGFQVIAGAAFIGEHSFTTEIATGRPDANDLALAKTFGEDLFSKFVNTKQIEPLPKGVIPGNRPYKDRSPGVQMAPETTNACIDCKICADKCPTGAIDYNDVFKTDPTKCMRCLCCVRVCPVQAKQFTNEAFLGSVKWCLENFKEPRKEPEMFI